MIDLLRIEHYRSISNLEFSDLSTVNILVGQNGVGKTTTLEAVMVLLGTRSNMLEFIGSKRQISNARLLVSTLFQNQEAITKPTLTAEDTKAGLRRTVEMSVLDSKKARKLISNHVDDDSDDMYSERASLDEAEMPGISISYRENDEPCKTANYAIHINHFHDDAGFFEKSGGGVFYMSSRQAASPRETAEMLTKIQSSPNVETELVKSLRNMAPGLQRLRNGYMSGAQPEILADFEHSRGVPVSVLGDGFCRLLLILTGLYTVRNQTVIIDDIDSGIHYERMEDVWKAITHAATVQKKQIFCVTHNDEMLAASIEGLRQHQDGLRIYRISKRAVEGKSEVEHLVTKYNYELFKDSLAFGMPIR